MKKTYLIATEVPIPPSTLSAHKHRNQSRNLRKIYVYNRMNIFTLYIMISGTKFTEVIRGVFTPEDLEEMCF